MRKIAFISVFLTLSFGMIGQSPFRIKVTDAITSENVEKAIVFIEEIPLPDQETDKYGIVSFQNVPEDRKVRVNVRKKGYLPNQTEIVANRAIKIDNNIIIKLEREPTTLQVVIYGEVTDKEGNEVEDATIEVSILGKPYSSKTDKSGNYQIRIDGSVLKSVPSFQIEAKKQGCERSKTSESIPKSEIINKDIVLTCSANITEEDKPENPSKTPQLLATQTLDGVKIDIMKFEKKSSTLIVHFTLENVVKNEQIKQYYFYAERCEIQNQEGVSFNGTRYEIGKKEVGWVNLVNGNIMKGTVEFNVGDNEISKAQLLTLCYGNNYAKYINVKVK